MCGIVAVFTTEPSLKIKSCIERSLDRVTHRGPDGRGLALGHGPNLIENTDQAAATWGLGHVRLAIVDLSSAAHQPMTTPNRKYWITYNGEVYNHVELRNELTHMGYEFRSSSDTEVIVASYVFWGPNCVERFNGMFAFVLVDLAEMKVLVARDRLGVKPIYLWSGGGMTVLVSEPKQLLDFPGFRPRVNGPQVVDFLIDGVLGHEPDQCCFEGVQPIPPAHTMSWRLDSASEAPALRLYWRPEPASVICDWDEAVAKTRSLLSHSVHIRLRSDVPVGSCLSGGLDSSSIVGLASQSSTEGMNTFSSCFNQLQFDESLYIDAVNQMWHAKATKVFPDQEAMVEDLDRLVYHQDEPFSSPSIYAQWCVMRVARKEGVPVLLDGQGGDELLCGYRKYAFFYLRHWLSKRRYWEAANHLLGLLVRGDRGLLAWRQGLRYLPKSLQTQQDNILHLLRPAWKQLARHIWSERMKDVRELHEHQLADIKHWSLPSLLRYEDRNSMAHSIETRLPFLDYRFVEQCLSLEESFFFRKGRTKRILVDAVGHVLPFEVKERRTKMGFETPSGSWMKGILGMFLGQKVRSSERLGNIMDTVGAGQAFDDFRNGSYRYSDLALFRIASLALWIEMFEVEA